VTAAGRKCISIPHYTTTVMTALLYISSCSKGMLTSCDVNACPSSGKLACSILTKRKRVEPGEEMEQVHEHHSMSWCVHDKLIAHQSFKTMLDFSFMVRSR